MTHRKKVAWACSWLAAGLAVALVIWRPGDASYWLSPLLFAPCWILTADRYEQRLHALPAWKLRALSVALLALACAGGIIAVIGATDTAYMLGLMLGTPLTMLLHFLIEDDDRDRSFGSPEGPWGLP